MTVLRTPLLSLGAHGTIGDTITVRRQMRRSIAEVKPIPSDPQSLLQLYQRWLYKDALYYWATLSTAQQAVYKALGNATNNTTIGAFLKAYLAAPPDIMAYYRLDTLSGGLTPDQGANGLDLTVVGATLVPATLDNGLHFDGLNDFASRAQTPLLSSTRVTLETIVNLDSRPAECYAIIKQAQAAWVVPYFEYGLYFTATAVRFAINVDGTFREVTAGDTSFGTPAFYTGSYDGSTLHLSRSGVEIASADFAGDIDPYTQPLNLGRSPALGNHLPGIQDQVILWDRCLSPEQILYHARRYGLD